MNAPTQNLRTDASLPVRLLVTAADDFVRELVVAEKKLQAAQREIARIERARDEVAAAIRTLGAVYEPPVEAAPR
jgi:hypothetical protein